MAGTNQIIGKDKASEELKPYAKRMYECWMAAQDALDKFRVKCPKEFNRLSKRSVSTMLYDLMRTEVERRFAGVAGVTKSYKYGRIVLTINGVMSLRFKKLDGAKNKRAYYTKTQSAMKFFEQQGTLEGMPPKTTNAISGYINDAFGRITGLYVTCPYRGDNQWFIELNKPDGQEREIGATGDGPTPPVVKPKTVVTPSEKRRESKS